MTGSASTEGQKSGQPLGQQAEFLAEKMGEVRREISKAIVGQTEVVDGVLMALLAGGHVLLEGAPGLGKTMLVRTLAQAVALKYSRIQFTPGPDAGRRDRHVGGAGKRRRKKIARISARADLRQSAAGRRNQSRDAQDAIGVARGDAGKAGHRGAHLAPAGRAVFRDGHAEPAGNGRNLSAAGSATRPVPVQAARAVSGSRGFARHSGPHDAGHARGGAAGRERRANPGDAPGRAHGSGGAARPGIRGETDAGDASGRPRKSSWRASTSATAVRRAARRP